MSKSLFFYHVINGFKFLGHIPVAMHGMDLYPEKNLVADLKLKIDKVLDLPINTEEEINHLKGELADVIRDLPVGSILCHHKYGYCFKLEDDLDRHIENHWFCLETFKIVHYHVFAYNRKEV